MSNARRSIVLSFNLKPIIVLAYLHDEIAVLLAYTYFKRGNGSSCFETFRF